MVEEEAALDGVVSDAVIARLKNLGVVVDAEAVVAVFCAARSVTGVRTDPPLGLGNQRQLLPHTRVFVSKPKGEDLGWDVFTAAAAFCLTGSLALATVLSLFQRTVRLFRLLSEAEMDMVTVIAACSGGKPYDVPVETEALLRCYEGDLATPIRLLLGMEKRGIVRRLNDAWILVR